MDFPRDFNLERHPKNKTSMHLVSMSQAGQPTLLQEVPFDLFLETVSCQNVNKSFRRTSHYDPIAKNFYFMSTPPISATLIGILRFT